MAIIRKREAAKRDLIAQWVWYAENASIEVADNFLNAVSARPNWSLRNPSARLQFFCDSASGREYGARRSAEDLKLSSYLLSSKQWLGPHEGGSRKPQF
jgi:hypothetical protein